MKKQYRIVKVTKPFHSNQLEYYIVQQSCWLFGWRAAIADEGDLPFMHKYFATVDDAKEALEIKRNQIKIKATKEVKEVVEVID